LGLAISRRLIELMGGMLDFSSEPDVGSRFWFTLPIVSHDECDVDTVEVEAVEPAARSAARRAARLLVAEDNAVNQRLMKRMLENMGHVVDIASDGYQAVMLAMANHHDIVIMDCSMPEMDGYQATAEIRRLHKEGVLRRIPVIALTANALPEDRERCLAAGMDDYLSKPIARDDLYAMLEKHLSGSPAGAGQPMSIGDAPVSATQSRELSGTRGD
jgi:CheY-like chemotaxis protein